MRELFQKLSEALEINEDVVLATVVASSGSTPRGMGARMLVTPMGRVWGTIGGGAVEYRAEQLALEALEKKRSRMEHFQLRPNQAADWGMICGGEATVCFHYISAEDEETLSLCRQVQSVFTTGQASWLIDCLPEGGGGRLSVLTRERGVLGAAVPERVLEAFKMGSAVVDHGGALYCCQRLTRAGRVYIFGGGHVAQALVPTLARVEFGCVVVDDREAFVNPALFPGALETRLADMDDLSSIAAVITEDDYICVMTRGHVADYQVERQLLRTPACYLGVIGSARKTAGVQQRLREDGFTDEDFARVTTPIGLDILSETPAEIAVSIAAQLIMVRARREKA